jgi:hypothetical protein
MSGFLSSIAFLREPMRDISVTVFSLRIQGRFSAVQGLGFRRDAGRACATHHNIVSLVLFHLMISNMPHRTVLPNDAAILPNQTL